ncbi:MAG: hypothetical protein PHN61_03820 [Methanothrix sp.]|nr:hypothetical protein [Methanothrix sp.]
MPANSLAGVVTSITCFCELEEIAWREDLTAGEDGIVAEHGARIWPSSLPPVAA